VAAVGGSRAARVSLLPLRLAEAGRCAHPTSGGYREIEGWPQRCGAARSVELAEAASLSGGGGVQVSAAPMYLVLRPAMPGVAS